MVRSRIMWFSTDGRFTEPILEAAILNDKELIRSRICIKRMESHRRRVGLLILTEFVAILLPFPGKRKCYIFYNLNQS